MEKLNTIDPSLFSKLNKRAGASYGLPIDVAYCENVLPPTKEKIQRLSIKF